MRNNNIGKHSLFVGLGLAVVALADNPVVSHRHLADPNGYVWNNRIYAICSNDDDNSAGYDMKSAVVISTSDRLNWTDHGDVFRVTRDAKWAYGSYAPTAIPAKGKIYMYFPNVTSGVGVLVADRPEGPYKDPLGKALINSTLCNGVAWCFDPDVFVDTDGSAYLVYGGGNNTANPYGDNIRGIALNADMISVKGSPVRLQSKASFEGPFIHKYKNNYYFTYPTNGGANIDYAMSSTGPISGYNYVGTVLPNPTLDGKNVNMGNNSHTSIFEWKGSWYMMYHDRRLTISKGVNDFLKRSVNIDKLEYNADGTMKKVVVTKGMAQVGNFNPYDSIPAATMSAQSGIKASFNATTWVNYLIPQTSGSWTRISGVDFKDGAKQFQVNAAVSGGGVSVEVRTGSSTGTLAGTCNLASTGSTSSFATTKCDLTGLSGIKDIYLKFVGTSANANFAWFRFVPVSTSNLRPALERQIPSTPTGTYEVYDLGGHLLRTYFATPETDSQSAWRHNSAMLPQGTYMLRQLTSDGANSRIVLRAP